MDNDLSVNDPCQNREGNCNVLQFCGVKGEEISGENEHLTKYK